MSVFGQPASDLDMLKTMLVDSLTRMAALPGKIDVQFTGEVGMGTRHEVETIAAEAIAAAKLAQRAPTLEQRVLRQEQGADCAKVDTDDTRTDCAQIDLMYHSVTKGEKALQAAVTQWTNRYLFSILEGNTRDSVRSKNLDEAVRAFFKIHDDYKKEAGGPALVAGGFLARTSSGVELNDGKYLTLAINGETYTGGAHGSPTEALNTFDADPASEIPTDDGGSQDDPDLIAIDAAIHGFYAWYENNMNTLADINYVKNGPATTLDRAKLDAYYDQLRQSGFISQAYIDSDRAYLENLEATYWKNENGSEAPLTGLDYDRFFCAQDYDIDFWKTAPVGAEGLGTDRATATLAGLEGGSPREQKFALVKENGRWRIAKIFCESAG